MWSNKFNSILKSKTKQSLEDFEVSNVINELKHKAPTLLSLLKCCLQNNTPNNWLGISVSTKNGYLHVSQYYNQVGG